MNYAFVPDLSALAILIVILMLVRRRHPQRQTNAWLLGLFITLLEAIAHTFYARKGIPSSLLHTIVVDCYLLAGLTFIWAAEIAKSSTRRNQLLFLALNGLPLLALNSIYGMNIRATAAYWPAVVAGVVIGLVSSVVMRRSRSAAALYAVAWTALGFLVHDGLYRNAVYWSLALVYAFAAFRFYRRLAPGSTGRLAIVTGFSILTICLVIHPWVVHYDYVSEIVSHVWNMQKSLISIGMILVMLEEQLADNEFLALHDELTGLPNRRLFAGRLSSAIAESARTRVNLALVVLDLNDFKKINDSLGHQAGDQVLREVSASLRKNVRDSDCVARLGGDEFLLVARGLVNEDAVDRFVQSIHRAIQTPIAIDGVMTRVTASVGVAIYPRDAQDATRLLRLADQRMYACKRTPMQSIVMEADMASAPSA